MRIRRWLRTLGASAAALLCYAAFGSDRAAAQQCVEDTCDTAPPPVTVTPAGATFVSATAPEVGVHVTACDAYTIGTYTITWRGTNVTSSWPNQAGLVLTPATCKNHLGQPGAGAYYTSAQTLTLQPGSNTFRADVCDERGNCNWRVVTWVWDNNLPPTISFTPTTSPADTMVTAAVAFADDAGLNWTTRSISINGVVDNGFTTSGTTATAGTYTKTFRLVRGRNVVRATITDVGGKTKTDSIVYVRGEFPPRVTLSAASWRTQADSVQVTVTVQDSAATDVQAFRLGVNGRVVGGYTVANPSPTVRTYTGYVKLALGENTLDAEACDSKNLCGRADSVVVRHNGVKVKPTLSLAYDPDLYQAGGATLGYSTAPYVSMDAARGVSLFYATAQARPTSLVLVDATSYADPAPVKMSLQLRTPSNAVVTFNTGTTEIFYGASNGANRLTGEFDASALATGRYGYKAIVRTWFPGDVTPMEDTITAPVIVLNEVNSPFGAGWTTAGVGRVHVQTDGLLVTDGAGGAGFHEKTSCVTLDFDTQECSYAPPAGQFATFLSNDWLLRTHLDGTQEAYTLTGLLTQVQDLLGTRVQYGYDAGNRLKTITDPAGQIITFEYNASGKLTEIRDPSSRKSTFAINTTPGTQFNNLTVAYDADGVPALQGFYDANHRLTYSVDRAGARTDVAYHAQYAAVDSVLAPARNTTDGAALRPVTEFRSLQEASMPSGGNGTSANPVPRVRPSELWLRVRNAAGDSSTFVPGKYGVIRYRDRKGRVGWSRQDAHGRDTLTVSPLGDTLHYAYNGADLTTVTRTRWGKDENESWAVLTDIVAGYEYSNHRVTREYGQRTEVSYRYTPQYLVDSVLVIGRGGWSTYTYDAKGRVLSATDAQGHTSSRTYQPSGFQNTATVTGELGTTSFTYDNFGRTVTTTGPTGLVARVAYDTLNRVRWASNPASDTVKNTFAGWNGSFLTTITDPKAQAYQFRQNVVGMDTLQSDPDGIQRTYSYDARGNVARAVIGTDSILTHFDARGRPDTIRVNGAVATTFEYDSTGFVRVVKNAASTDTIVSDSFGNVVRQTTVRGGRRYTVKHAVNHSTGLPFSTRIYGPVSGVETLYLALSPDFNASRQLTSLTATGARQGTGYPDFIDIGKFEFAYNGEGMLSELRIPTIVTPPPGNTVPKPGDTLTLSYTSAHGLWSMRYQRYVLDSIAGQVMMRDSLGRVIRQRQARGDSVRLYEYGARGDLVSFGVNQGLVTGCPIDAKRGENCGYWGLGKRQATYSYDRAGNPTYDGPVVTTGNRLTQFRGYTMEYDARGNLTRRYFTANPAAEHDRRYFWNALGQLDSVRHGSVTVAKYQYDGLGRRVRKVLSNGAVREFVYDGDNIVMELDINGVILAGWVHGGVDQPLAMRRGDSIYYYLRNHQGSIVALMNKSGAIRNQHRYDPWGGSEFSMDSVINFYRYTGREYDAETGLYYYRARYYDPVLRRFVSKDPIGLHGGINPYAYVENDPVNATDPSGLAACEFQEEVRFRGYRPGDPQGQRGKSGFQVHQPAVWLCDLEGGIDASDEWIARRAGSGDHDRAVQSGTLLPGFKVYDDLPQARKSTYWSCVTETAVENFKVTNEVVGTAGMFLGKQAAGLAYRQFGASNTGLLSLAWHGLRHGAVKSGVVVFGGGSAVIGSDAALVAGMGGVQAAAGGGIALEGGLAALGVLAEGTVISLIVVGGFEAGVGIGSFAGAAADCLGQ